MGRNRNPYQSVDWDRVQPLCGCTHMHCVNDEQFQRFVKQGLEFVTLANYHPSVPWYPLKDMRKRSLRTGQKGCFRNGSYIEEYTDFTQYSGEDPDKGGPVFSHIPENLLEAPNAEHHWFSDYNVYLHISAPGSYMASGYPDVAWNGEPPLFDLQKSGFQKGFQKPWKEAFSMLLDRMISPDGGGIIINHPVWSHMPIQDILDMLDFDDRVLGIEIYNDGCDYDYTETADHLWDAILSTGRQCFGFCVQDHPREVWRGRIQLLPEERTAESALKAMRQGAFYGSITGEHHFKRISFDGRHFEASWDGTADEFQLITAKGVAVSEYRVDRFSCDFTPSELAEHRYLRCTARFGRRGEKIYSQPVMFQ